MRFSLRIKFIRWIATYSPDSDLSTFRTTGPCSITARRSTISAKYLHKSCRYVDYLSTYLQNICIKVAEICRYVNCLSTYLQTNCIKVADICRYVNCLSKYLQKICIKIADICRYANCLSIYSISTTQQKIISY
jgi:hypothetical protein